MPPTSGLLTIIERGSGRLIGSELLEESRQRIVGQVRRTRAVTDELSIPWRTLAVAHEFVSSPAERLASSMIQILGLRGAEPSHVSWADDGDVAIYYGDVSGRYISVLCTNDLELAILDCDGEQVSSRDLFEELGAVLDRIERVTER